MTKQIPELTDEEYELLYHSIESLIQHLERKLQDKKKPLEDKLPVMCGIEDYKQLKTKIFPDYDPFYDSI